MKKLLALAVAGTLAVAAVPGISAAKSRVESRHPSAKITKTSSAKLASHKIGKLSLHKSSKLSSKHHISSRHVKLSARHHSVNAKHA